jgi:hypothetical protein
VSIQTSQMWVSRLAVETVGWGIEICSEMQGCEIVLTLDRAMSMGEHLPVLIHPMVWSCIVPTMAANSVVGGR